MYRGQPKEFSELPLETKYDRRPFFSATWSVAVAKKFSAYAAKGLVFAIKVQPGVRFLKIEGSSEAEVFIAANGVATYGEQKVRVKEESVTWAMAIPVTYSPKPTAGRRKTRRRTRRRV